MHWPLEEPILSYSVLLAIRCISHSLPVFDAGPPLGSEEGAPGHGSLPHHTGSKVCPRPLPPPAPSDHPARTYCPASHPENRWLTPALHFWFDSHKTFKQDVLKTNNPCTKSQTTMVRHLCKSTTIHTFFTALGYVVYYIFLVKKYSTTSKANQQNDCNE